MLKFITEFETLMEEDKKEVTIDAGTHSIVVTGLIKFIKSCIRKKILDDSIFKNYY